MIRTPRHENTGRTEYMARFRVRGEFCDDFVVSLSFIREATGRKKHVPAAVHVSSNYYARDPSLLSILKDTEGNKPVPVSVQVNLSRCSQSTSLEDVARYFRLLPVTKWQIAHSKSGSLNFMVDVVAQSIASQEMFVVRWTPTEKKPTQFLNPSYLKEVSMKRMELLDIILEQSFYTRQATKATTAIEYAAMDLAAVGNRLERTGRFLRDLPISKARLGGRCSDAKSHLDQLREQLRVAESESTALAQRRSSVELEIRRLAVAADTRAASETSDRMLFAAIIDFMRRSDESQSASLNALTWVSTAGHIEIVNLLLEARNTFPSVNDELAGALLAAARQRHAEITTALLDTGIKILPGSEDATTCSLFSAISPDSTGEKGDPAPRVWPQDFEMERLLLRRCCVVRNEKDPLEYLVWAARHGYSTMVKAMLEEWFSGPEVNARDDAFQRTGAAACKFGQRAVLAVLLEYASAANIAQTRRGSPLPGQVPQGSVGPDAKSVLRWLSGNDCLLSIASSWDRTEACKELLKFGADPEGVEGHGDPLMLAIQHASFETARLLLDRGASHDSVSLFAAAFGRTSADFAHRLVFKGAKLDVDKPFSWRKHGRSRRRFTTLDSYVKEKGRSWTPDFIRQISSAGHPKEISESWLAESGRTWAVSD